MTSTAISPRAFITAILRNESRSWPWGNETEPFLEEVGRHSMEPLIAWHLKKSRLAADWPQPVLERLDQQLREHTVREAILGVELTNTLDALAHAGLPALLMKGTALAYTLYPTPTVRRRGDTDLLVRGADRDRVTSVLTGLGFQRQNHLQGEHVGHQALFRKNDAFGVTHDLDVHWKINNRPLFADMLTWDDLEPSAVPVPALGAHARALGTVHALTLACVHPVAHHGDMPAELRWIYDIHLLASAIPETDVESWVALVRRLALGAVCAHGLNLAREDFGSNLSPRLRHAFDDIGAEPSARYLTAGPWIGDVRLSDLRTTPGTLPKMRLIREVVLPTPAYMREAYGVSSAIWLPPLYVYRIMRGCWRLAGRVAIGSRTRSMATSHRETHSRGGQ
jgi:hypothetical protein